MASKYEPTKEQKAALKSPPAAKLMVLQLNKDIVGLEHEVSILKKTIKILQDEAEKLRSKHHTLDKQNAVLRSQHAGFTAYETMQAIVSFGGAGFGFYLMPSNTTAGSLVVGASVLVYILLAWAQKNSLK